MSAYSRTNSHIFLGCVCVCMCVCARAQVHAPCSFAMNFHKQPMKCADMSSKMTSLSIRVVFICHLFTLMACHLLSIRLNRKRRTSLTRRTILKRRKWPCSFSPSCSNYQVMYQSCLAEFLDCKCVATTMHTGIKGSNVIHNKGPYPDCTAHEALKGNGGNHIRNKPA